MLLRHESFRRLCLARDLLADTPEHPLSIDAIAHAAQVSPFHFIRQFEAVFGSTPHQYRMQRRLERARRLLAAGDQSVTDICLEVGFSSLGSFSDLFKRRVGETPTEYRRRMQVVIPVAGDPLHAMPGCLSLMWHLPSTTSR